QLKEQDLIRTIESDCELTFKEIDKILLSEIKMLEPFGVGNPQPVFLTKNVDFVGYPRIVGKDHLKIKVREDNIVFEAIGFGQADAVKSIEMGKKVYSIFYHLRESKYRNRKEVQLHLLKIEKLY
ncbi:hypothetical protein KAU34_09690, partial [candidate division WOR-3 bacterium]|nr:hypothetical protein [candidate division WOR-3 bacterium]